MVVEASFERFAGFCDETSQRRSEWPSAKRCQTRAKGVQIARKRVRGSECCCIVASTAVSNRPQSIGTTACGRLYEAGLIVSRIGTCPPPPWVPFGIRPARLAFVVAAPARFTWRCHWGRMRDDKSGYKRKLLRDSHRRLRPVVEMRSV